MQITERYNFRYQNVKYVNKLQCFSHWDKNEETGLVIRNEYPQRRAPLPLPVVCHLSSHLVSSCISQVLPGTPLLPASQPLPPCPVNSYSSDFSQPCFLHQTQLGPLTWLRQHIHHKDNFMFNVCMPPYTEKSTKADFITPNI